VSSKYIYMYKYWLVENGIASSWIVIVPYIYWHYWFVESLN
jgi:hypothetical protein